jgi:hypothetical protein
MKLRDHPLMTRKSGIKTWPPLWTTTVPGQKSFPFGEIGTLEQAIMHQLFDNKIFLFVQYDGDRYMGMLHFDDRPFCRAVFNLLNENVGRAMQAIGNLDVSRSL